MMNSSLRLLLYFESRKWLGVRDYKSTSSRRFQWYYQTKRRSSIIILLKHKLKSTQVSANPWLDHRISPYESIESWTYPCQEISGHSFQSYHHLTVMVCSGRTNGWTGSGHFGWSGELGNRNYIIMNNNQSKLSVSYHEYISHAHVRTVREKRLYSLLRVGLSYFEARSEWLTSYFATKTQTSSLNANKVVGIGKEQREKMLCTPFCAVRSPPKELTLCVFDSSRMDVDVDSKQSPHPRHAVLALVPNLPILKS